MHKKIPTNKNDPCNATGGWFYVNRASIDFVTPNGDIGRITKKQLQAAIAIMEQNSGRRRAGRSSADASTSIGPTR
jgi:hypothetical protein